MNARMRTRIIFCIVAAFGVLAGCKQKQDDNEAIRAAVRQHLSSLGTLNLQAMEMDFTNISVQNNQASADVSFHPKTGAPAGATMQVSYQLENQDGAWKVIKKSVPGGMIEHPDPNANPHGYAAAGSVHGKLPDFQEILGTNAADPNKKLPANHPPIPPAQPEPQP
jgi:hypothetical protein